MYRVLVIVLLALLLAMQYRLWVGSDGWADVARLRGEIETLRHANAELHTRNQALEAEINSLKTGDEAMEERARSDLGMVKEGEDFFLIVEPKPKSGTPADRQ